MSPRWFKSAITGMARDRLWIWLQPHGLTLVRTAAWNNGRIIDSQMIDIPPLGEITASKTIFNDGWQPVISALGHVLRDPTWQATLPKVVLSSHFVRYSLIPWNAELATAGEQESYLRHCFVAAYGEPAQEWDLCSSPAGFGKKALASGVSPSLLEAIRSELAQADMAQANIFPSLMMAANHTRDHLGKGKAGQSSWFVSLEPGRLCLTMIENSQWRSLVNVATGSRVSEQLSALMQRESIISGLDTSDWPILVHWAGPGIPEPMIFPGHIVSMIPTRLFVTDTGNLKKAILA